MHGYPIKAPMLDIHTVGAGGGSIAHVDSGGLLKVGPRSAGADPGPACYGRGNGEPTVTDANIVLQTLNPGAPAGRAHGGPAGSRESARSNASLVVSAWANGDRAWHPLGRHRQHGARDPGRSRVQRGHDPRDYTLMAFGGAGPLHAARLARELDIGRVLVPRNPGILCAMGLLLTDLRADFASTRLCP